MADSEMSRRRKILEELVATTEVTSQIQFVELLAERGITASQSTVSRDLEELGILKNATGSFVMGNLAELKRQKGLLAQLLQSEVENIPRSTRIFFIQTKNESAAMLGHLLKNVHSEKVIDFLAMGNTLLVVTNGDHKELKKQLRAQMAEGKGK